MKECFLDTFIKHKSTTVNGVPFKKPFKSVSWNNNQVCLFPDEVETDLCKKIAMCFGDEKQEEGESQSSRSSPTVTTPNGDEANGDDSPLINNNNNTNGSAHSNAFLPPHYVAEKPNYRVVSTTA